MADGAKTIVEADPEVSESHRFCRVLSSLTAKKCALTFNGKPKGNSGLSLLLGIFLSPFPQEEFWQPWQQAIVSFSSQRPKRY